MADSVDDDQSNVEKIPMTEENGDSGDNGHTPSQDLEDDILPHKVRPTPHQIFSEFTQRTTLHGLKLILAERVGIVRRIIWFILFLTCTVMTGFQFIERLLHFHSFPTSVKYEFNFDRMTAFPTVTICNQNTFRVTAAFQREWFQLIEEIFSSRAKISEDILEAYKFSPLTIDQIYLNTAHKKEDMIVACRWQNEVCGPENFTEVLTDQGVCYSFNDKGVPLYSSSTGSGTGLNLTLNAEQYEYMPGSQHSAGVKILLHDRSQFPRVAELGLSVGVGSHISLGVENFKVRNLPPPHGNCKSGPSRYFDQYTPDACLQSCMTSYLDDLFGCRHVHLPHEEGNPPVCTVEQYMNRVRGSVVSARDHVRDTCECPPACNFQLYEAQIAQGRTLLSSADQWLSPNMASSVRKKYQQAREILHRMDPVLRDFTKLIEDFTNSVQELPKVLTGNRGINSLHTQKSILATIYENVERNWRNKKHLLQWQSFQVRTNFATEETKDSPVSKLAAGREEFWQQLETRLKQLAARDGVVTIGSENVTMTGELKTLLYVEVLNLLSSQLVAVEKTQEDYYKLYNAYSDGQPIFNEAFLDESPDDNVYIIPTPLLNFSLTLLDNNDNTSVSYEADVENVKNIILSLLDVARNYYQNGFTSYNQGELQDIGSLLREWASRFTDSQNSFLKEIINYPVQTLNEKMESFDKRWMEFVVNHQNLTNQINLMLLKVTRIQKNLINFMEEHATRARLYITAPGNVTKQQVAELIISEPVQKSVQELTGLFQEVRTHGQLVNAGWGTLTRSTNSLWETILEDENLENYYTYKNMSEMLLPYSQVSAQVARNYTRFRDSHNFTMGQADQVFLRHFQRINKEMKEFVEESAVGLDFVRNNFLRVEVFTKEKGYQQVIQQAEYGVFDLLCDIGGTMALYLGASLLTICELVDLGLHHTIYRMMHGQRVD